MTNCIIEEPLSCYNLTQLSALIHGGSTDPGETLFFFPVECLRVSDPLFSLQQSSTHARHLTKPGSLWRPVLPALTCTATPPSCSQSNLFLRSSQTSARHPSSALIIHSRPQPGTRPRLSAFSKTSARHPSSAPLSTPASVRLPSAPLSRIERFPCPRPGTPSPETPQSLIKLIVRIDKIPQHIGIIGKASQPGLYGCLLEMFW